MGNFCIKRHPDYNVNVVTGDKRNAGMDSNFKIILHDDIGNKSKEYKLNNRFRNNFERGRVDRFKVNLPEPSKSEFGRLAKIEFWRDNRGIAPAWYLERIEVTDVRTNEIFTFPVFRWVKAHHHYVIIHLDTSLPQEDENKEQRHMELDDIKKVYVLAQKVAGGPAQVRSLPDDEMFSWDYKWNIVKTKVKLIKDSKIAKIMTGGWDSLDSVKNIYNRGVLKLPLGADRWQSDLYFGWQRIGSCSYDLIKICKEIPDKFGVTDEMLKPLLEGKSLQEALDSNSLYIVDLDILVDLPTKENHVVCAPLALFYQNDQKQLLPVAIQLFQNKAEDNPVFLPSDPKYTWLTAKMWYNMADASYHQSLTHLAYTHLLMEGVSGATHRNLSLSHPVFKLLAPHFLYLIAINTRGLDLLISPGGWVDKTMSIALKGMVELIIRGLDSWRINVDGQLPERLKERGLLGKDTLENFPFRDDAVLLYGAIKRYVTKYINHYYDESEKIFGDWELQSWGSELRRPRSDGGVGIKGIAGNGNFATAEDIIEVATAIVYTCTVGHASTNFPQYDEYAFPPNYPGSLNGRPPKDKTALTEMDILYTIPDKAVTLDIVVVTKILSGKGTKSLGNFEVNYIFDPPAKKFVEEFRAEIREIGNLIRERNKTRDPPYPYLDPYIIPNSISI